MHATQERSVVDPTPRQYTIEALRTYRERTRKPDYQALSKYAKVDRVERVMRPYLEAVL